jgi:tRNA nucleotidyltransferase (CCA-adding enzyme)
LLEKREFSPANKNRTKTLEPMVVDLISSRQEFYEHPSALPTVERGSIKLDLHRRDFTINTLAIRLDGNHFGELHDYYGGVADLERKYIRVLHSLSFVDDPTRMLRAVRYEQRYRFSIEPRTLQLIEDARPLIAHLSSERLRHEIDLILEEQLTAEMLARLDELGLLKSSVESLPWNHSLYDSFKTGMSRVIPKDWDFKHPTTGIPMSRWLGYLIWLSSLSPEVIDKIQSRLKFPISVYKSLIDSSQLLIDLPKLRGSKPSAWVSRLEDVLLIVVYAVFLLTGETALQEYAIKWRHIHPTTDGHALNKMGLAPGPEYQKILHNLRSALLDGEITSKKDELIYLDKLLKSKNVQKLD